MNEFLEAENVAGRAEVTYILERGDKATEDHPPRRSRQTVSKRAQHSSTRASSSHKGHTDNPRLRLIRGKSLRLEAGFEPIFSAGEHTKGEEEDSSANWQPRSQRSRVPVVTGEEETFITEKECSGSGD